MHSNLTSQFNITLTLTQTIKRVLNVGSETLTLICNLDYILGLGSLADGADPNQVEEKTSMNHPPQHFCPNDQTWHPIEIKFRLLIHRVFNKFTYVTIDEMCL